MDPYLGREGSRTGLKEELTCEPVPMEASASTVRSFEAGVIL